MESSHFNTSSIRDDGELSLWNAIGMSLWNAIGICDMSETSWQMGRLRMKDVLEIHSEDQ